VTEPTLHEVEVWLERMMWEHPRSFGRGNLHMRSIPSWLMRQEYERAFGEAASHVTLAHARTILTRRGDLVMRRLYGGRPGWLHRHHNQRLTQ